jgi:hypothetical protein
MEKKNQQREIAGKMDSTNIMCGMDAFDRRTFWRSQFFQDFSLNTLSG